jgi:hypothetical protein
MKLAVKLVDTASGNTSIYTDECADDADFDGWFWFWAGGNNSCDCVRSQLLWGNKKLNCNNGENQIQAYLLADSKEILLNHDSYCNEKVIEAIAKVFNQQT